MKRQGKGRFGFRSIQTSIFFYTTAIGALVVLGAVALYLFTTANTLRNNYILTSNQMAKLLSSRMDTTMRQLDTLQARILESDRVREYAFSDFADNSDRNVLYTRQSLFEREIFTIAGYDYPFHHLSILTEDGALLHFGRQFSFEQLDTLPESWQAYRDAVFARRGSKVLVPLPGAKLYEGGEAVAISRGFSRYPLNEPKALMEIQLDYASLESAISATVLSYQNASSRIIIYDADGQPVYPLGMDGDSLAHYTTARVDSRVKNPNSGQAELVCKYPSDYTGWTVAVVTPFAATTAGLSQYLWGAVLVGCGAILLALLLAYKVAKTISAPIISIKESLQSVDITTLSAPVGRPIETRYNELELLQSAVGEMQTKLDASLNDYVQMRALSIQSRLLALQSQMDPHFLYNTLAIMAILAEEHGDDDVAAMCRRLVAMLRYISTEREATTLGQELEHTRQYAELIHIRFGNAVQIAYDVNESLYGISMPPMIVQPLVENSVKYARSNTRPSQVRVAAYSDGERWYVEVADNGDGFSEQALRDFGSKVDSAADRGRIQQQASGVGLANIYRRLQLFYEGEFEFTMENRAGGAYIKVGGALPGGGRADGTQA
ncbi:histidine kinase [Ruminococcaceae bacterium OttesenSCG-928-D13]|nr:histidine kinase [Ruminococcaceae bacterium OttesenSCG-928-D13]